MTDKRNLSIDECCNYYSIEISFVRSLNDHGLIELTQINETHFIDYEHLPLLEKYMHLHYDLDINIEGIEVISRLLEKIEALQSEIKKLAVSH